MQPIFSRNENIDKMAFMNWRMSEDSVDRHFINLADGYLGSAIILAKQCLICNSDKKADILIFPILANANHGIELYLKAMTLMLNRMLNVEAKIEGKHNIGQIFRMLKSKIKALAGPVELKAFEENMLEVENYIEELVAKIESNSKNDKMDFSRYPISKDYENHFYVDTMENVEVDLENFIRRFEVINDKLRSFADHFYDASGDNQQ
jgi:hypothetical protein